MNAKTKFQDLLNSFYCSINERVMVRNVTKLDILVALLLLSSVILSSCGTVPMIGGVIPLYQPEPAPDPVIPLVFGPEAARDTAIDFIQTNFGNMAPDPELVWMVIEVPSDEMVGASNFQYRTNGWVASISFPVTAPESTIYTAKISQDAPGFSWEGLVNANGHVVTANISFEDPMSTPSSIPTSSPEPTPTFTPDPTSTTEPTSTPDPGPCNAIKFIADNTIPDGMTLAPNVDFNKVWRLKNTGSCTWNKGYDLVFIGGTQMDATKVVDFQTEVKPGESVKISAKMTSPDIAGEYTGLWMLRSADGEIFGLGDAAQKAFWVKIRVTDPGSSTPPPEEIYAWEGYIWGTEYGAQFDDCFERTDLGQPLLFGIEAVETELKKVILSLRGSGKKVRLQGVLFSNVIDYNGSQILVTHIEVKSPAPDPKPCNAIKFIADLTVPDGTVFGPDIDFIKVWRLKNIGRCTWNDGYDLVLVDGNSMNALKRIPLPADVKPGESMKFLVKMTSPDQIGNYMGSWMLQSADGELFGIGEAANKAFWVKIRVDDPKSSTPPPEEISAWEGYIRGTEDGAQFDDYFERTDLGQTLLFGIEAMEAELKEELLSLRDSGKKISLEGTLYSNVIDYNSSQILITKIEVLE